MQWVIEGYDSLFGERYVDRSRVFDTKSEAQKMCKMNNEWVVEFKQEEEDKCVS
jgi:hypothetical protein